MVAGLLLVADVAVQNEAIALDRGQVQQRTAGDDRMRAVFVQQTGARVFGGPEMRFVHGAGQGDGGVQNAADQLEQGPLGQGGVARLVRDLAERVDGLVGLDLRQGVAVAAEEAERTKLLIGIVTGGGFGAAATR